MDAQLVVLLAVAGMIAGWIGIAHLFVLTRRQLRREFHRAVWPLWDAYRQLRDGDDPPGRP